MLFVLVQIELVVVIDVVDGCCCNVVCSEVGQYFWQVIIGYV